MGMVTYTIRYQVTLLSEEWLDQKITERIMKRAERSVKLLEFKGIKAKQLVAPENVPNERKDS